MPKAEVFDFKHIDFLEEISEQEESNLSGGSVAGAAAGYVNDLQGVSAFGFGVGIGSYGFGIGIGFGRGGGISFRSVMLK
jgi:hypothetical protein